MCGRGDGEKAGETGQLGSWHRLLVRGYGEFTRAEGRDVERKREM